MILPWDSRFWLESQDFTKKHIILTISSLLFLIPCHKLYFYIYHIQCLFLLHNATLAVFFPVGWYKYCVLVLLCVFISSDCYYASSMLQLACQFLLASLVQIFHWSFFQFHLVWFSYTDFLCSAHSHVLHLPFTYFNTELDTMHLFTLCIFALLSVDLFYMVGNHMTIRHFN